MRTYNHVVLARRVLNIRSELINETQLPKLARVCFVGLQFESEREEHAVREHCE